MALQNRVTPEGDIVATPARGFMLGNRGGCIHDGARRLTRRRWASRQWIVCRLEFKGRHRQVMTPGRYTELFFLDEATALAAGHRPCFECRREAALQFAELWGKCRGQTHRAAATAMDQVLHAERLREDAGKQTFRSEIKGLPDGAMVCWDGEPHLVWAGRLLAWSFAGYGIRVPVPERARAEVLTPAATCGVLLAGYRPSVHVSANIASHLVGGRRVLP